MTAAPDEPDGVRTRDLPEHGVVLDAQHPWPGLASFVEHNRHYFRGRDADADEVIRLIESSLVTVIYGLAGLGKTSLLQAGVFPRLRETNWLPVPVRLDFDDETPLTEQVFEALAREIPWTPERWGEETLWEFFHRGDVVFWNERHRVARPVLVFDQFEELFTIGRDKGAGRSDFLAQLTDLAAGRPSDAVIARLAANAEESERFDPSRHRYGVVLSLREDYLAELDALRALYPGIDAVRKRVTRMNGRDALAVVEAGKDLVDPATERAIVSFVGGDATSLQPLEEVEVDPALLSVVCAELNNKRLAATPPMATIDRGLLDQNRDSILADFYASAMKDFEDRPGVRELVEDGLLTPNGYRASMTEDQAEEEFGVGAALITELVNRRLVRVETRGRARRIELTHDLLTRVIRESRDRRRDVEKQIAEAGRAEAERREQKVRARLRVTNIALSLVGIALVLVLVLVAAASAFYRKYRAAQQEAQRASGQWATRLAIDYINVDRPADALAYLAHAMRMENANVIARRLAFDLLLSRIWYVVRAVWPHNNVRFVQFSDDGKHLLILAESTVTVRDLPDGPERTFQHDTVSAIGFVGAGSRFVTAVGRRILIRDAAYLFTDASWDEDADITNFYLSPDGSTIAVHAGDQLAVREIGGALRFRLPVATPYQLVVQFSGDGSRLAVANSLQESKLKAAVWETATGKQLGATIEKEFRPNDFEIDPTLTYLAIANDDSVTMEPLAGTNIPDTLSQRTASEIAFRPDGKALLAVIDGRVYLRAFANGRAPIELLEKSAPFGNGIAYGSFTADGLRIVTTAAVSGQMQFWTPEGDPLSAPIGSGDMMAVSADGSQLARGTDKSVTLLTTPGLMQLAVPSATWVEMSADEKTLFVQNGNALEVLDATDGHPLLDEPIAADLVFTPPERNVAILRPSRDGEPWMILDPATGQRIEMQGLPRGKQTSDFVTFSGNGKRSLIGKTSAKEPFVAWVHDLGNGALIRRFDRLPEGEKSVDSSALSFDGDRVAFAGASGAAMVFDVKTGQSTVSDKLRLLKVRFSRDGKELIGQDAGFVLILDARTLSPSDRPFPGSAIVTFVDFSDDTAAKYIVTGSRDGSARIWLRNTMEMVGAPLRHRSLVVNANFSADGKRLATSTDLAVHTVWDTKTGLPVTAPHGSIDIMVTWLGIPGRRFPIADRSGFGRVIELPEGVPEHAAALAELAEQVAGLRFRDTMTSVEEPLAITVPSGRTDVALLLEAFQGIDSTRRLTPFTDTTVESYVRQRLEAAGTDRDNVARKLAIVYPGAVPDVKGFTLPPAVKNPR